MRKPIFGKKTFGSSPPPPPSPQNGGGGGSGREAKMPWQGTEDAIAGNLAYAHLTRNLPIRLEVNGRVHAETLLAAAGAVCGYCCQRAILARVEAGEVFGNDRLLTLRGANGHTYVAGDALNEMFYGGPGPAVDPNASLWRLLNGTAVGHGLAPERLPSSSEIFTPMAATLGQPDEGCPSVDEKNQPLLPIDKLLHLIWPLVSECLVGKFAVINDRPFPAPIRIWPAVSAWSAVQTFGKTLEIVDPRIAVLIIMQSAAFASKLDRRRIEIQT